MLVKPVGRTAGQTRLARAAGGVAAFGSWARGDANAQSDVDLLIVLDEVDGSYYREIDRIADATFELGLDAGRSISGVPASEQEFEHSGEPLFSTVRREGVRVA